MKVTKLYCQPAYKEHYQCVLVINKAHRHPEYEKTDLKRLLSGRPGKNRYFLRVYDTLSKYMVAQGV